MGEGASRKGAYSEGRESSGSHHPACMWCFSLSVAGRREAGPRDAEADMADGQRPVPGVPAPHYDGPPTDGERPFR